MDLCGVWRILKRPLGEEMQPLSPETENTQKSLPSRFPLQKLTGFSFLRDFKASSNITCPSEEGSLGKGMQKASILLQGTYPPT